MLCTWGVGGTASLEGVVAAVVVEGLPQIRVEVQQLLQVLRFAGAETSSCTAKQALSDPLTEY